MKPSAASFEGPIKGLVKQYGIWITEGSSFAPLVYFQKPKWIKDEETWLKIIKTIRVEIPRDIDIT